MTKKIRLIQEFFIIFILSLFNVVTVRADITTGLIIHWKFEENPISDGTTIVDATGNGNDAAADTDNGADSKSAPGRIGLGMQFDGTDDWVYIASTSWTPDDAAGDDYSIAAWIWTVGGASFTIGGWSTDIDTGEPFAKIEVTSSGAEAKFLVRNDAATDIANLVGGTISPSTWHHVIGVKDGTDYTLYLDTVSVATTDATISGTFTQRNIFMVGCGNNGASLCPSGGFNGIIDEFRVYDRALEPADIQQLYAIGSPGSFFMMF